MPNIKRELLFQKRISCSPELDLSLDEKQIQETLVEFIWFYNGTNNVKFLIDNNHLNYIDLLYNKYSKEIDNLIKYYDLAEIIEESEYFHGWFNNWKQLDKFTKDQFLSKLKTDFDFSSLWADFGMSDSMEFRNWGIQINYDNDDRAKISHQGKDQFKKLLSSIGEDPENGLHVINIFNPSNIEDRLIKSNWLISQFFCQKLTYEERVKWFFQNYYETGMEYEILLNSFKDEELDSIKWYDDTIQVPKYNLNISSNYNNIETDQELEKLILFNYFLLKYTSTLFNYLAGDIIINSTYRTIEEESKNQLSKYKFEIKNKKFDNINLELNDFNFIKI